jgi:hypothetical protein
MFSCDYNGWADVREEEREGIEAFEAALPRPLPSTPVLVMETPLKQVTDNIQRRAA